MTGASGALVTYALHQSIRYDYPGPIHHLAHRLMIVPPLVTATSAAWPTGSTCGSRPPGSSSGWTGSATT